MALELNWGQLVAGGGVDRAHLVAMLSLLVKLGDFFLILGAEGVELGAIAEFGDVVSGNWPSASRAPCQHMTIG